MTTERDTHTAADAQRRMRKLRPSNRAVKILAMVGSAAFALALVTPWLPTQTTTLPLLALFVVLLLLLADLLATHKQPAVQLTREMPNGLALNQWAQIQITVNHSFDRTKSLVLFDGLPNAVATEGARAEILLKPEQHTKVRYRLRALRRGPLEFSECHVQVAGPFGLWIERYVVPLHSMAKVYPNFAAITAYTLLASENHTSQLGIRTRSRRGQGSAFHQLREYRRGDSLRQLDWNATAKRQQLISKEYQDERDQNLVIMIDSGRRMRSQDDELSHFDHALNASILISYIALRQGDSVGVMSFGNGERWIAPQKGGDRVKAILNNVYDLQAGSNAPDYLGAAEKLTALQRKRSLVVLVTNSRDEEIDELLMAIQLLKKRHLVMVANIREAQLDQALLTPVGSVEEAATYAGTVEYMQQRAAVHKRLQSTGVLCVDTSAAQLPAELANSYWEIKRAGTL